jgi:hypothetical protein
MRNLFIFAGMMRLLSNGEAMREEMRSVTATRSSRPPSFNIRRWAALGGVALLAGCSGAQEYVDVFVAPNPTVKRLTVCHGYGCRWMTDVRIEPAAQAEFAALFQPASRSAADERVRLGRAIALFEIKIGVAVGTSNDRYAAATLNKDPGQLDCIDETVNTTTYLRVLENMGLMRFHRIGEAAQRGSLSGFAFNDFITNTAVIVEKKTGALFAIDSYFYGNGREPKIMPLAAWRQNWRPSLDDPKLQPVPVASHTSLVRESTSRGP